MKVTTEIGDLSDTTNQQVSSRQLKNTPRQQQNKVTLKYGIRKSVERAGIGKRV